MSCKAENASAANAAADAAKVLRFLQREIHSAVFATVDGAGLPQTCVIDVMLADEGGIYFLTARGKAFYDRLMARGYAAVSGFTGADTLSSAAVSVRGAVRCIGKERLEEIFAENPYMAKIYPTERSREALEVFQLYRGTGEFFDLSQIPPCRRTFSFGGQAADAAGYRIEDGKCSGCGECLPVCPTGCIRSGEHWAIDGAHCLHCGNCLRVCPAGAVVKIG